MTPRRSVIGATLGAVACLVALTALLAVLVTAVTQGVGGRGVVIVGAMCVALTALTVLFYGRRRAATRAAAVTRPPRRPSPRPR